MENTCCSCLKPKAKLTCQLCESAVCKNCAQFLEEGQFSFLAQVPAELNHILYCQNCYEQTVAGPLADYQAMLEKAKEILVYESHQGKETRLLKRIEKPVHVKDCPDREEALLRLAFFALQAGYNAIIDVDLKSAKVRTGSYQTHMWSGSGIPAQVTENRIVKDRSFWHNPN